MKKTIKICDTSGKMCVYEVVNKIPSNFFIWNIGENIGTREFIPIAEWLKPEDKEDFHINIETVKVIPVNPEEWAKLDKAASLGVGNLKEAEKAIKSKRSGYWTDKRREIAKLTIDIFKRIT